MLDPLHRSSPPLDPIATPAPSFKPLDIQYASSPPPAWSTLSNSQDHHRSKITPFFSALPRTLNLPPRSSYSYPAPCHSPVFSATSASELHASSSHSPPQADRLDAAHSPSYGPCPESFLPNHSSTRCDQTPPHVSPSAPNELAHPPSPFIPSSTEMNHTPGHSHTSPSPASPSSSSSPAQLVEPFFDSDVVFPPLLLPVDADQIDCQLANPLGWEEWARSRVSTMMAKQPPARRGSVVDVKCGLPLPIRLEAVRWLLQFDVKIEGYPSLPPNTRYRAVVLYSTFWSLCRLPEDVSEEMAIHMGRLSAVVSLILATKVDVDAWRPLFAISLNSWTHQVAKWIKLHPADVGDFERVMLQELDYKTTAPTPFDFITELFIACPELDTVMGGCGLAWERAEEAFGNTLENALRNHGFVQFRTPVLATAALFLALEKGPFRHPGEVGGPNSWARHLDGSWHEMASSGRSALVSVALKGSGVIVDAHLMSSVCQTMKLAESEVRRCRRWCRSLGK